MKLDDAVRAMSALAQESRLAIFRLLVAQGTTGLPAGKIAETIGVSGATLSFHLKELVNSGLLDQKREGRSLIYSVNFNSTRKLFGYLMEDCCQGRPELCDPDYNEQGCCDE